MPSFYSSLQVGGFKLPFVTIGAIMMMLVLVLFLQQLSVASTLGMILLLNFVIELVDSICRDSVDTQYHTVGRLYM